MAFEPKVGDSVPPLVRTTDLAHWNRYAAINDEFIPIHMDPAAARAAGQRDVFGMGNLRLGYLHAALDNWVGNEGDIALLGCQFRGLNFKGDELVAGGRVTAVETRDSLRRVDLELSVMNQAGENTTPGRASLVLFDGGKPAMPEPPAAPQPSDDLSPGVYLDAETIEWIGKTTPPQISLPVGENDIRRWSIAIHYPETSPDRYYDHEIAAKGPWGGLVAPRDFNPFPYMRGGRVGIPWMRGMGTEPGTRVLNGGQRNLYFERIRPGDVVTSQSALAGAFEREGKLGTMLFLETETRWTNQHGALVRIGTMTTIYY